MKLSTFLREQRITYREFGERVGVSGVQIGRIANGHRTASLQLARMIEKESGGRVKAVSLTPDQQQEKETA